MAEYLENLPSSVPEPHRQLLGRSQQLETDSRIVGVAVGGSLFTDSMDESSDLDLIVVVELSDYRNCRSHMVRGNLKGRQTVAER